MIVRLREQLAELEPEQAYLLGYGDCERAEPVALALRLERILEWLDGIEPLPHIDVLRVFNQEDAVNATALSPVPGQPAAEGTAK